MQLGDEIEIFSWFKIHFVENEGMAFGLSWGSGLGKLALTSFRIVAVFIITYLLRNFIRKPDSPYGLVFSLALIWAGAVGNIIDSAFYGQLFSDSWQQIATFMPKDGGYAPWLHGKVVDMLYFPLYEGFLPQWLPVWGGQYAVFFRPVFNLADTAISLGVAILLIFQNYFFSETQPQPTTTTPSLPNTDISEPEESHPSTTTADSHTTSS